MLSENNKRLQKAIAPALKLVGFKKNGGSWRKRYADSIGVLNLQGSQWESYVYVNLGIYFCALGDNEKPCEYHCHVRTRLEELVPDRGRLIELLDLEQPISEQARFPELEKVVTEHAVSWLDRVSTVDGAREYCRHLHPKSPWVTADFRRHLNLKPGALK